MKQQTAKTQSTKVKSELKQELEELKVRVAELEELHDLLVKRMRQTGWISNIQINNYLVKEVDDPSNILIT